MTAIRSMTRKAGADQAGDGDGDRGLYRAGDQVPTRQGNVQLLIRPRYTPQKETTQASKIHKYRRVRCNLVRVPLLRGGHQPGSARAHALTREG